LLRLKILPPLVPTILPPFTDRRIYGHPADHDGDGARGLCDHDPQVARFSSRASLSVADTSVVEGDTGRR
jgi:hypothetical protein